MNLVFVCCLLIIQSVATISTGRKEAVLPRSRRYLKCPPCNRIHCRVRRASKLHCKGGIVKGICNCCPKCAKTLNEPCGGEWNYLGKCDRDLVCESPENSHRRKVQMINSVELYTPPGKCKKRVYGMGDQGIPSFCKPPCKPDFCRENPNAICSAIDNAVKNEHSCQSQCHHTSCSACRFERDSGCPKCPKDDASCLRKFGKCVRRQYCTRRKFPCRSKKFLSMYHRERGRFVCYVPDCNV